jgi:biopolymer transport protein TolR
MAFSMAGGGPSSPQMNVTPLIDVLLVLLIIFMLVVMQERPHGLEAQIPQEPNPNHSIPPPDQTIVIQVKDGRVPDQPEVKINEDTVAWSDLHQRLVNIFSIRVERVVFVKADNDIEFQKVADVIDTAHSAGIDRVGLLHDEAASTHPHVP